MSSKSVSAVLDRQKLQIYPLKNSDAASDALYSAPTRCTLSVASVIGSVKVLET
jgi:hypothetical protein